MKIREAPSFRRFDELGLTLTADKLQFTFAKPVDFVPQLLQRKHTHKGSFNRNRKKRLQKVQTSKFHYTHEGDFKIDLRSTSPPFEFEQARNPLICDL